MVQVLALVQAVEWALAAVQVAGLAVPPEAVRASWLPTQATQNRLRGSSYLPRYFFLTETRNLHKSQFH